MKHWTSTCIDIPQALTTFVPSPNLMMKGGYLMVAAITSLRAVTPVAEL